MNRLNNKKGFTLIEVLVVIALISVLSTLGFANFSTAQKQGTDVKRKSDLGQVKNALELYYSVNNNYPTSIPWGGVSWSDSSATYMKEVPKDPKYNPSVVGSHPNYCYQIIGSPPTAYTLYAKLENDGDKDILTTTESCSGVQYNYKVASPF